MTNLSLDFGGTKTFLEEKKILFDAIKDRGSIFTPVGGKVKSKEQINTFLNDLVKEKPFKNATHNSYAYRVKLENGSILEGKGDDGEVGAGLCILRELQRENYIDSIVVISRHFGGVKLQSDRFKHIINATKMILT